MLFFTPQPGGKHRVPYFIDSVNLQLKSGLRFTCENGRIYANNCCDLEEQLSLVCAFTKLHLDALDAFSTSFLSTEEDQVLKINSKS